MFEEEKFPVILVTGGAGFIGSNFIAEWLAHEQSGVVNLDKLTYAGNLDNLASIANAARYAFVHGDINDQQLVEALLRKNKPRAIMHFAAETHVDRSIHGPGDFIQTNIVGTFNLLEATRAYLKDVSPEERTRFRFIHVSTDEVYGSLPLDAPPANESTPYAPSSPYSASKASSDHLVRAYHQTYQLPAIVTNCSNNYGPRQFPEKLIPLMIFNASSGKNLPIYGDGRNFRDWLYVTDHCAALRLVVNKGRLGETYNIGGNAERSNWEVVNEICSVLDDLNFKGAPHKRLIEFVRDRPGHDRRYALDTAKLTAETGWRPIEDFTSGLRKTVQWYLDHPDWTARVVNGEYKKWVTTNYEARGTE